jgi:hypothetical protein
VSDFRFRADQQAQLAQVIFAQQSGLTIKTAKQIRPCNTPTSATMPPCSWHHCLSPIDDMESQDERMVEELLDPNPAIQSHQIQTYPSSPYPSYPPYQPFASSTGHYQAQTQTASGCHPTFDPSPHQSCAVTGPSSLFTSTDPFYIAQLQEKQRQTRAHDGAFAVLGRPDERSPFLLGAQSQ